MCRKWERMKSIELNVKDIDKAIKVCETNIKKIEDYNDTVGSLFDRTALPYHSMKKLLVRIKSGSFQLRKFSSRSDAEYYDFLNMFIDKVNEK